LFLRGGSSRCNKPPRLVRSFAADGLSRAAPAPCQLVTASPALRPLRVILRAVAGSTPAEAFALEWILRLRFAARRMTARRFAGNGSPGSDFHW